MGAIIHFVIEFEDYDGKRISKFEKVMSSVVMEASVGDGNLKSLMHREEYGRERVREDWMFCKVRWWQQAHLVSSLLFPSMISITTKTPFKLNTNSGGHVAPYQPLHVTRRHTYVVRNKSLYSLNFYHGYAGQS